MVDCSSRNLGCNGGYIRRTLNFILYKKTVYERSLPYTGVEKTCPNVNGSYKITGWTSMTTAKDMLKFL